MQFGDWVIETLIWHHRSTLSDTEVPLRVPACISCNLHVMLASGLGLCLTLEVCLVIPPPSLRRTGDFRKAQHSAPTRGTHYVIVHHGQQKSVWDGFPHSRRSHPGPAQSSVDAGAGVYQHKFLSTKKKNPNAWGVRALVPGGPCPASWGTSRGRLAPQAPPAVWSPGHPTQAALVRDRILRALRGTTRSSPVHTPHNQHGRIRTAKGEEGGLRAEANTNIGFVLCEACPDNASPAGQCVQDAVLASIRISKPLSVSCCCGWEGSVWCGAGEIASSGARPTPTVR